MLGAGWGVEDARSALIPQSDGTFVAQVDLYLVAVVDGVPTRRYGVGADKGKDVDKILKTALAEALKKAGHAYGIALYLWDADGRKRAETRMKLDKNRDSESTLKKAVFDLAAARNGGVKPGTAAEVAKIFGRKAGELADKAVLVEILESEGVL